MHIPYHHPDTIRFLKAIKKKYKPTRVICVGDEVDKHAMSFHDSDPDLPSAGDELNEAIKYLKQLYKVFPRVDLVDSNHGSMVYRKGKHHGDS
jgi:metallophosphoesterase superfamily enzyme